MATQQTAVIEQSRAVRYDLKDCRSVGDVLEKAKLNYRVELAPLFDAKGRKVETGHRALARMDTGETIAVVGSRYTPVQTTDFLAQLEPVIKDGSLRFVSALSVDSGRALVVEAQHAEPIKVKAPNGKDDVLLKRVLYRNTYDGTQPMALVDYLLRQWCTNGATHMLGMTSHVLRHTASVEAKVQQVIGAVGDSIRRFKGVEQNVRRLLSTGFTLQQMQGVAARLWPVAEGVEVPTRTATTREGLVELFQNGQGTFGRSAWDALNAVTEYNTHHRPVRGDENKDLARLRATWLGLDGSRSGYEAVMAEAGLPA